MANDTITIGCSADISTAFTRAQHNLSKEFESVQGITGVFDDLIPSGGTFPLNSSFAARVTTLAQQRLNFARLNLWQPMVGGQENCDTSCQPPVTTVDFANAQHNWYRLFWINYKTEPYCLTQLFADKLNVVENIAQVLMNLKSLSRDLIDEFARNNHVAIARHKWLGLAPASGTPTLTQGDWAFATDANGFPDTSVIILEAGIDPNEIALLSVGGMLNNIRERGSRIGTFPVNGDVPVLTDWMTFQELPFRDTNVRADNRHRQPGALAPSLAATTNYAGYQLKPDQFAHRYNYSPDDAEYPGQTILRRVNAWQDETLSEGCFSDVSDDYENASFTLVTPWGGPVFKKELGEMPSTAGSGTSFANPTKPWNGMNWVWFNEVNEVTPQNSHRNLGYWDLVSQFAARPMKFGNDGHVILVRRFPFTGITGTCATLAVTGDGSVDCTNTCPAMDFFPPALEEYTTCGCWNPDGNCPDPSE